MNDIQFSTKFQLVVTMLYSIKSPGQLRSTLGLTKNSYFEAKTLI